MNPIRRAELRVPELGVGDAPKIRTAAERQSLGMGGTDGGATVRAETISSESPASR